MPSRPTTSAIAATPGAPPRPAVPVQALPAPDGCLAGDGRVPRAARLADAVDRAVDRGQDGLVVLGRAVAMPGRPRELLHRRARQALERAHVVVAVEVVTVRRVDVGPQPEAGVGEHQLRVAHVGRPGRGADRRAAARTPPPAPAGCSARRASQRSASWWSWLPGTSTTRRPDSASPRSWKNGVAAASASPGGPSRSSIESPSSTTWSADASSPISARAHLGPGQQIGLRARAQVKVRDHGRKHEAILPGALRALGSKLCIGLRCVVSANLHPNWVMPTGRQGRSERDSATGRLLSAYHQQGDARARERLVELYMPLVEALARRHDRRGAEHDDLVQAGSIGLLNAIERFDPKRGEEFVAFAVPTIEGEMKRHIRDRTGPVRLPRRLHEASMRLPRAREELTARLSRAPTPTELAREVGVSPQDLPSLESATSARLRPRRAGGGARRRVGRQRVAAPARRGLQEPRRHRSAHPLPALRAGAESAGGRGRAGRLAERARAPHQRCARQGACGAGGQAGTRARARARARAGVRAEGPAGATAAG